MAMQRNALLRRGYNSFWSHSHRHTLGTSLGALRQQANLITTWSPVHCEHTIQTSFRLFRAGWIVAFGQPRVLDGGSQYEMIERLIKTPLLEHRDFTGALRALRDYSGLSIPRREISVQYLGTSPFLTFSTPREPCLWRDSYVFYRVANREISPHRSIQFAFSRDPAW